MRGSTRTRSTHGDQFSKWKVLVHVGDGRLPDKKGKIEDRSAPSKLVSMHTESGREAILEGVRQ